MIGGDDELDPGFEEPEGDALEDGGNAEEPEDEEELDDSGLKIIGLFGFLSLLKTSTKIMQIIAIKIATIAAMIILFNIEDFPFKIFSFFSLFSEIEIEESSFLMV